MQKLSFGLVLLVGISTVARAESLDAYPPINDPIPFQEFQPPPMPPMQEQLPPMMPPMAPPCCSNSTPPIVLGSFSGSKHPVSVAPVSLTAASNDSEQLLQLLREQQKIQVATLKNLAAQALKTERDARLKKKKEAQDQYNQMVKLIEMDPSQNGAGRQQMIQMLQMAAVQINLLSQPGTKEKELERELSRFDERDETPSSFTASSELRGPEASKLKNEVAKELKAERDARLEQKSAVQNQIDQVTSMVTMGALKQDGPGRMQIGLMLQSLSAQRNKLGQPGEKERELERELSHFGGK